jgi:cytochrome d ubiquinol oxidase subunit I
VSPSLSGSDVMLSLLLYVAVYLVIYPVGLFAMLRIVWRGPVAAEPEPVAGGLSMAPIAALAPGATAREATPPEATTPEATR